MKPLLLLMFEAMLATFGMNLWIMLPKIEAAKGHHLARQNIDLRLFGPVLPYFWMLLDRTSGMPRFTTHGFDVCPPDLPSAESPAALGYLSSAKYVTTQVQDCTQPCVFQCWVFVCAT